MKQQDLRSFSILSFSFCFSPSPLCCAADRLAAPGSCVMRGPGLNGCEPGTHFQMRRSDTLPENKRRQRRACALRGGRRLVRAMLSEFVLPPSAATVG